MTTEPNDRTLHAQLDALLTRLVETDRAYHAAVQEAQANGGALVKYARATLNLTQRALAEQLDVDFSYISKVENSRMVPGKPFLRKLTQMLAGDAGRQTHTPDATSPLAKAD